MRETGRVLLAYLDESYTKERYYIASLIVPQDQAAPLTAALDKVVEDAAYSYSSVSVQGELHGKELFQGQGVWRSLKPRQRIGIYNAAFQAIADHDVEVIIRGVHCERLKERYIYPEKPHKVVLGHLLERIDERAAAKDELALVIADEVQGQNLYRQDLWTFQRYSTPGYRARKLSRILDTMHFVPSHASRLVQAADLVAFLYRRRMTTTESDERATRANDALWARVEPRVRHSYCWYP